MKRAGNFITLLLLASCTFNAVSFTSRLSKNDNLSIADNKHPRRRNNVALNAEEKVTPKSQLENLVANSKSISILRKFGKKQDADVILPSMAAGAAVALAMVPEAVAFSFVAGVNPLVGLWTTVALGFVAAATGGRAGICSSASGACSVVIAGLCKSHGPAYLSGCALLAGMIQMLAGALGLGKFIRLVPHPVMLGFVNGLAIVMTRSQLGSFRDAATGAFLTLSSPLGRATYGITALTMFLIRGVFPKVKNETVQKIPPTLGAVAITSIISRLLNLPLKTLGDVAGAETFRGGLAGKYFSETFDSFHFYETSFAVSP